MCFPSVNSDMGLHFQNSSLQAPYCSGKEPSDYVLQHDLVFALLQSLWRVHIFCNHADTGLAIGGNDLILSLAHEWAEVIAASSARVIVFVAPDLLGLMD